MTYDSINEEQKITYFDTKNSEYVSSKLSDNLLRVHHAFFKKISLENNLKVKSKYRPIKGKQILMGEFIISASAFAIYKRFERKFGGTLNSFNFKPEQVVTLSKVSRMIQKDLDVNKSLDLIKDSIKMIEERNKES